MADPVDFDRFREGFLAETREILELAAPHLLALDHAARDDRNDPKAVRELFRSLHTIKGLSSMVGVEPIVEIAHALEGVLRQADRGHGRLGVDGVDLVAAGVRAIEQRVAAIERDEPVREASQDLLAAVEAISLVAISGAEEPALDLDEETLSKLTPAEREVLASAVREGRRVVSIDFAPTRERAESGVTINSVRERVGGVGEIVRVLPISVPAHEEAPGGLLFRLIVVTSADDASLAAAASSGEIREVSRARVPGLDESADEFDTHAPKAGVVRVEVERLDTVMQTLSALIVVRFRLEREAERLRSLGTDTRELQAILREQRKQIRDLRSHVIRVRTVPVSEVLARLPLLVRGAARAAGKKVRLEVDTGRSEVDKAVADRMLPAVVHLVRNAIDHGIEPSEVRRRTGKPEEGLVRVTCHERSNNQLELTVSDDGRGIDAEAVARRAGTDAPLIEVLSTPGFSTLEHATTTSGRGLGMDIVRRIAVQQLRGELQLDTAVGRGSTFRLLVPLRLAILDVFAFACGAQTYVVPVSMVSEIIEVDSAETTRAPGEGIGRTLVQRRGRAVPLVSLSELFDVPDAVFPAKAILVELEGHRWAFGVDRMLGQHEVVVHTLDHPLVRSPGVSGATDLGDGRPSLVLDLVGLGRSLTGGEATA